MLKAGLLALVASFSLSDSVHDVTPDNFEENVLNNPLPVVVDFYADWCESCPEMRAYFEEICAENKGFYCASYDFDLGEEIPLRYGVDGLPAFRFFCDGEENPRRRIDGRASKEELERKILEFAEKCD